MVDPLSLTLATITLANALKELVVLAQLIDESFAKVSRNTRELRSLASEIKITVFQLQQFSDDHYDILCNAVDMKIALLGLIACVHILFCFSAVTDKQESDMRKIHDRCREMFPPVPPRKMDKFKVALSTWMSRNRIEEDIKGLRDRVNKCHSQFLTFAVMRIENHLVVIRRQNDQDSRKTGQEIAAINALSTSDDNLISFMQSNARTLSKLPPEITAASISDAYLCLQINAIDGMLTQLSSNLYPVEGPPKEVLFPYRPVEPPVSSYDKHSIRQEIVLQSLKIQSSLRSDSENLSIQAGAWSMLNLCVGLEALKMYREALTTGKWTANLFRTLAKINSKTYLPYLVDSLHLLSRSHVKVDDIDSSFTAIKEAVEISKALQPSATNIEIEFQLGNVLTTLAFTWGLKDNKMESFKAAQEGVYIYKNAINSNRERTSHGALPVVLFNSPCVSLFDGIAHTSIIDYGRALNQLSISLQSLNRLEDAYNTGRKALEVMMMEFSTDTFIDDSLQMEIASMLRRISHQDFHKFISLEEALSFSQREVALIRLLCAKNPQQHCISLCNALWEQANILGKMERHDEALILWQKTSKLANELMTDRVFRAEALTQLPSSLQG